MQSRVKQKIIFDTDIGSDIDDSYALGYLLHHPDVDLIGVTTVTGEAYNRALLCKLMIEIDGKDTPVYVGENHPLTGQKELQPICHMSDLLNEYKVNRMPEAENASDYLVDIVNKFPDEITLVSVAPFTNVARAMTKDPDFGLKLKRLVIMGGKIDQGEGLKRVLDWNILCDVKAGEIMLNSPINDLTIFPCDLTNTVYTPSSYLKENIHGEFAEIMNKMGNNWFDRDHSVFHYHDPMAAVYCVHPEFFTLKNGYMNIKHDETGSYTIWKDEESGKHHLALTIDREAFLKELYGMLNK